MGGDAAKSVPLVSVIVPVRNERAHIEGLLASILAQEVGFSLEVIVADGMSDDGTDEVLRRFAERDVRIRVIPNADRIVSTGLNAAVRSARGEIVVRMDAHTQYASDYIARCVGSLLATGADNVGGPWRAVGSTYVQSAVALAFQSPFSSGGAGSHRLAHEGPVDSVYLGCWRRETLLALGPFDEELIRNQDDELNLRLIRAGGLVWQDPRIESHYSPRSSLRGLARQQAQYGYWKVRVIQKHRFPASVRHLVPGAFVASLLALAPLAILARWARTMLAVLMGLYAIVDLAASLLTCRRSDQRRYLPVMPLVFAAFHLGYGWGFLRGMVDLLILQRHGRRQYEKLTR